MLWAPYVLEAVRICGLTEKTRIYRPPHPSYGLVQEVPQRETTLHPRSPYGAAKPYTYIGSL